MKLRPSQTQVGGDHYVEYDIQPMEFFHRNKIPKPEGDIIQYVLRFRNKHGKEDLLKARHIIDMLLELEYGPDSEEGTGTDTGA
jgi:hypothetical protein